ncbi:rhamnulokinase [Glutamicibacter uratoxydans]|uniref:rhamnulokinase n=1 Tax=Glutamicibacter uratoxydans TaxID=43667 RepID=UPI003D6E54F6
MSKAGSGAPVAAIDLGATSGRVMIGEMAQGKLELRLVHRFANGAHPLQTFEASASSEALAWDLDQLWTEIRHGLRLAFAQCPQIASIGVDSWAVDYALLQNDQRLGQVRHYRDPRNERAVAALEEKFGREELYTRHGLQYLPFNTIYQLQAELADSRLSQSDTLLLVPDYINWLLTGQARSEWTNVSTTGMLDQTTGTWNAELVEYFQLDGKLPPLIQPGEQVGTLRAELAAELGASSEVQVIAVASHDTASAVAAAPLSSSRSAYVSCGTWGLVGVELSTPVLTEEARITGFTNELGIDSTVRFLKNVTGTWLLSESINYWNAQEPGNEVSLAELLAEAEQLPEPKVLIDPQDERYLSPGDLPVRVSEAVVAAGGTAPASKAEVVRVAIESLAESFAQQSFAAARFAGFEPDSIHMVGGGSQGQLLCQRTADRAGVPVIAGPVECTALGNVLVQLRAVDTASWETGKLREMVRNSISLTHYQPEKVNSVA